VPVGEGHIKYLQDCIDSVEAQEFLEWELIIVDDTKGQSVKEQWFMQAYPFAKVIKTGGSKGAGYARNRGAEIAKGQFLFFLDADDMLNANRPKALGEMLEEYKSTKKAVYSDYIGRSFIDDIRLIDIKLQKNIIAQDADGETWINYEASSFRCDKAIRQPEQDQYGNVYLWCNISTLIPTHWHEEINGFDESLPTWEDTDYWWRMAKAGKCFSWIRSPYLIYRFYSGTRRELAHQENNEGRKKYVDVLNYLKQKHEGLENMGCNCGSKKQQASKMPPNIIESSKAVLTMADSDYVEIEFHFGGEERGNYGKKLVSPTGKLEPNGKLIEYKGYTRRAGDKFYVHKDDQAAKPDMFRLVPLMEEKIEIEPPKAPEPILSGLPEPVPLTLDLSGLSLNAKQIASLEDAGLVTVELITEAGQDGILALDGFGKVSALKLLDKLNDLA